MAENQVQQAESAYYVADDGAYYETSVSAALITLQSAAKTAPSGKTPDYCSPSLRAKQKGVHMRKLRLVSPPTGKVTNRMVMPCLAKAFFDGKKRNDTFSYDGKSWKVVSKQSEFVV